MKKLALHAAIIATIIAQSSVYCGEINNNDLNNNATPTKIELMRNFCNRHIDKVTMLAVIASVAVLVKYAVVSSTRVQLTEQQLMDLHTELVEAAKKGYVTISGGKIL